MDQENDELDRYSEELLAHVRDLLTVSDPEAEGRLFNGSIGWNLSPEPIWQLIEQRQLFDQLPDGC